MARSVISVINQKGGVGKTTTVINLASALAQKGKRILVVDLDPQGNATTGLGKSNNDESKSIYNVLIGKTSVQNAIQKSNIKNLDLIGSNVNLSGLEVETANDANRAFLLKKILLNENQSLVRRYENIFIDCPPALNVLTINALVASNSVMIPMQCEYFALEGLSALISTIRAIRETLNSNLKIEGLLRTMYDKRNSLSGEVSRQLETHFGNKVYDTVVPRNVRLAEAPSYGEPAISYAPHSKGARAYILLADEMLKIASVKTAQAATA